MTVTMEVLSALSLARDQRSRALSTRLLEGLTQLWPASGEIMCASLFFSQPQTPWMVDSGVRTFHAPSVARTRQRSFSTSIS